MAIFAFLFFKQYNYQKKIGLGSIYSLIVLITGTALDVAMLIHRSDEWKFMAGWIVLFFAATIIVPALHTICLAVRKNHNHKSGE